MIFFIPQLLLNAKCGHFTLFVTNVVSSLLKMLNVVLFDDFPVVPQPNSGNFKKIKKLKSYDYRHVAKKTEIVKN